MLGTRKIYQFNAFSLDPEERILRRKDHEIFLRPKALDTLLLLVEQPGHLVAKRELFEKVWPDASVSDAVLTHCIAEVRQALQDDPRNPRYIKTIPRSGYKFVANVREITVDQHEEIMESGPAIPIRSIAVLPFTNMSADPDSEYFCEGLAKELINGLTRIETLRVVAHSSSFSFKGQNLDAREIGRQLNVGSILEGSVRRSGNRLRISAQLINAADGYHLWSEQYDRHMDDIFAIEDEISSAILQKFRVTENSDRGSQSPVKPSTQNLEAYQLYLKGRSFWHRRWQGFLQKSMECFQNSFQMDPRFALAYVGLADAYGTLGVWAMAPPSEVFPKASDLIRKALEIDAGLAEAHASQALISMFYDWDWDAAAEQLRQAIKLKPGRAIFHLWNGHYLSIVGRFPEAIKEVIKAQDLDPLSPIVSANVGWTFILASEYERAIKELRTVLEIDPQNAMANFYLGYAYVPLGRYKEAIRAFQKAQAAGMPLCEESIGLTYSLMRERRKAMAILQSCRAKIKKHVYVPSSALALIYAGLGDHESVYDILAGCIEERDALLPWIQYMPGINQLVRDPRMRDILDRIGLRRTQEHVRV